MPTVVLVSGHYLRSKRKAGFHWLADAYHRLGWRVLFICGSISYLSVLRRDHRLQYAIRSEANELIEVEENLFSYVWWTPYHPANLRSGMLNRLAMPLFRRYGRQSLGAAEPMVGEAELVIVESTPALMLADQLRRLAPHARFVYRVSDDLRILKNHPAVLEAEQRLAPRFDRISVPVQRLAERFEHLPQTTVDPHGIARHLFSEPQANPYNGRFTKNAVFVGVSRLDEQFITLAAERFADVGFHLIGDLPVSLERPNIIAYGEMPFAETVGYIQHADVGLHCLALEPGMEIFAESLKTVQYRHCGLPIITPEPLVMDRPRVFGYRPGDADSIARAMRAALAAPRSASGETGAPAWDELAQSFAG
jgi:2-beta-glucuronyltransferase